MIYDTLNNLPNYLGMSENLDAVIEFVMARDINNLPAGKTRILGDKAVVTVSTVTPQTSDKALFQRRDSHLTLETDLEGSELFEVSLGELTPTKPADEAADLTVGTAGTSIAGQSWHRLRHLGVLAAGRQSRGPAKADGRAGSRPAENRRSQIKKQSSTQRRLCGAFSYSILGNNSEAPAFWYTHLLFRPAQTCPACQWLSLWESCHRR